MKLKEMTAELEILKGVNVSMNGTILTIKGPKGEVSRSFPNPLVQIKIDKNIIIHADKPSKREKKMISTYEAHIANMLKGVVTPFVYELKICSTHFPMNVSLTKNELIVKNFYGEKAPRILKLPKEVDVKLKEKNIEVTSPDKEKAGMVASNIEQLTRISNKDLRVFQDGIYIINKAGKELK